MMFRVSFRDDPFRDLIKICFKNLFFVNARNKPVEYEGACHPCEAPSLNRNASIGTMAAKTSITKFIVLFWYYVSSTLNRECLFGRAVKPFPIMLVFFFFLAQGERFHGPARKRLINLLSHPSLLFVVDSFQTHVS